MLQRFLVQMLIGSTYKMAEMIAHSADPAIIAKLVTLNIFEA